MSEEIMILSALEAKIKVLGKIYKDSKDEIIKKSLQEYTQLWHSKNKEYGNKAGTYYFYGTNKQIEINNYSKLI
jgi:hypothetical protein